MTSVVDTSVKHFHSGMFAASVLNGVAGSQIGVITSCLVTGFDTKTATSLVVAGGVATLAFSGSHSAVVESVVLVEGSSIAALNGEQRVTVVAAGQVKFATAAADGTATGTITFKMAPAGWTQPFTGTNIATYKSADPAGTGMILRVDDTAGARCRVIGYEQMTDINTGTGPFPTNTQMAGGGYWAKSVSANTTAVPWMLVCDGRKFLLHCAIGAPSSAAYLGGITLGFGDDIALRPGGDPYACSLNYSISSSATAIDGPPDVQAILQCAMPRGYTGLGSSVLNCVRNYSTSSGVSGMDGLLGSFPPLDGGLRLSQKFLSETLSAGAARCNYPGLYHVPHTLVYDTFKPRDIVTGTGALAGRKLLAFAPTSSYSGTSSSQVGISFADITGPWR